MPAQHIMTPMEDMHAASAMLHLIGKSKKHFAQVVRTDLQTCADWSSEEWQVETRGKEDMMFMPFLGKPFEMAIRDSRKFDAVQSALTAQGVRIH